MQNDYNDILLDINQNGCAIKIVLYWFEIDESQTTYNKNVTKSMFEVDRKW